MYNQYIYICTIIYPCQYIYIYIYIYSPNVFYNYGLTYSTKPSIDATDGDAEVDNDLVQVTTEGHDYWVLNDTISDENLMTISEYRNSEQNNNLCTGTVALVNCAHSLFQ